MDEKILGKIKKCLALAQSDNPNEAATALRQAQALMAQHGITSDAVLISEIGESSVDSQTMARNKPSDWEAYLAATVGLAFNCQMLVSTLVPKESMHLNGRKIKPSINRGSFIFVGPKSQVELASYTAQVLIRKCKRARESWIKTTFDLIPSTHGKRAMKTRLGDQFARGWVAEISKVVKAFAISSETQRAITAYLDDKSLITKEGGANDLRNHKGRSELDMLAMISGVHSAKDETLLRPVGSNGVIQYIEHNQS